MSRWSGKELMKVVRVFALTLLSLSLGGISGCASGIKGPLLPPDVVSSVDLSRYAGTWYEIASYPNSFQKGCVGTKATYTLGDNDKVSVVNECYRGDFEGKYSSAKGSARVVDQRTNAKLKVTFFWPFYGDYWIIDLGEHYEYAVVGHPAYKYLWVLSRTPQMEEAVYQSILKKLEAKSYDPRQLVKTPQR